MNPNDPDVINLSKAIFQRESGGDFNAVGDAGTSHGAGQWQPGTWKQQAKNVLGDENAPMTPDNQKAVIQVTVAQRKAAGLNPAQIAAEWNSGKSQGWENHVGTTTINGQQIHYDTPKYVKDVTELYQSYKGQGGGNLGYNPQPFSNPANPGQFDFSGSTPLPEQQQDRSTLGGQLGGRVQDASQTITDTGQGISDIFKGDFAGGIPKAVSGALQTAGAVAGGVGDIANAGLELIPGVKQAEGLIGEGVRKVLDTEGGQKFAQSAGQFAQEHPTLTKNAGAVMNIATAIPILKGVGVAKNLVMDAASQGLKGTAERAVSEGLNKSLSATIGGRTALKRSPDGVKTLIDERAIPEIVDGKFSTAEARSKLEHEISRIEDSELQPALAQANVADTASRVPLAKYREQAVADAVDELRDTAPIERYFERLQAKYGDYPTLQQVNEAKRTVSNNITEAGFNSPSYSTDKIVRSTLQTAVEESASALGLADVNAINAKMRRLFKAESLLKHLDGKSPKQGMVGKAVQSMATAGGEAAGNVVGVPLVGAYTSYKVGGAVGKRLGTLGESVLKRTGKGAERQGAKDALKKTGGAIKGALLQKAAGS